MEGLLTSVFVILLAYSNMRTYKMNLFILKNRG